MSVRSQGGDGGIRLSSDDRIPFRLDAIHRYRRLAPRAAVARDPAAKMSYVSFRGYYWSLLMGERFPYESMLECHSMVIHDLDPSVRFFRAQPQTIKCRFEGKPFRYTPDLHVGFVDGTEFLLEVKTSRQRKKLADRRLQGMAYACAQEGLPHAFLMDTGDEVEPWEEAEKTFGIYDPPLLSNSLRARAAPAFLTDQAILNVSEALNKLGLPCRLGTLCKMVCADTPFEVVLALVALRVLSIPLANEITVSTLVTQGSEW